MKSSIMLKYLFTGIQNENIMHSFSCLLSYKIVLVMRNENELLFALCCGKTIYFLHFLAHLSRRLIGELIVYQ